MKIIEWRNVYQIYRECIIANKFTEFRIHSYPFLMTGDMELDGIASRMFLQSRKKRRTVMIHVEPSLPFLCNI
ncbi:hypothetical protein D3C81_867550 [compost metagenome]